MDLNNRVVVVTGAGTGIGRAIALAFAEAGAAVVCVGRRPEPLEETVRTVEAAGGRAVAEPVDVTDPASVFAMVNRVIEVFGRVDVLFNNAGRFESIAGLWEADPQSWWLDVTVNLRGPMLTSRAVLPRMIAQGEGIILNMNGGRPTGGSGYACGKAGLMEMTRVLAEELKMHHPQVLVFGAGPGLVQTPMTELQVQTEAGRRWIPSTQASFAAGRTRQPQDIARKAVELVRRARPAWNGRYIGPDTDLDTLDEEASR